MTGHIYKKKTNPDEDDDQQRVIMKDCDANSSVTSSDLDHGGNGTGSGRKPNRAVLQILDNALHSTRFQVFVVVIVILTCMVVVAELLIDLRILQFDQKNRSSDITKILYYVNILLLGIFVVEIWVKIAVWRFRFFKHRLEMMDAFFVFLTFSLVLAFGQKDKSAGGIGFLVMIRLWRLTKILNSIVGSVRAEADRKMLKERRARRALEREVCKLKDYCLQQECELDALRMLLRSHDIPEPPALRLPPTPHTVRVIAEINQYNAHYCSLLQQQKHCSDGGTSFPSAPPSVVTLDSNGRNLGTPGTIGGAPAMGPLGIYPPPQYSTMSSADPSAAHPHLLIGDQIINPPQLIFHHRQISPSACQDMNLDHRRGAGVCTPSDSYLPAYSAIEMSNLGCRAISVAKTNVSLPPPPQSANSSHCRVRTPTYSISTQVTTPPPPDINVNQSCAGKLRQSIFANANVTQSELGCPPVNESSDKSLAHSFDDVGFVKTGLVKTL